MARPLRIDVAGGWYHIPSRGQRRQLIYCDGRDRSEFIARLAEASRRYRVEVHAYVLMPNHYHLLLRTPKANASAAMQWLNNCYGMWWNRRHGQVGHVFQGRFKSILVEEGAWSFSLSLYLHFNPVAVRRLGLGKRDKKAEALGLRRAAAETVKARLETLRTYRWSSYRAYAGYEASPDWLKTGDVLARVEGGQAGGLCGATWRLGPRSGLVAGASARRNDVEGTGRKGRRDGLLGRERGGAALRSHEAAAQGGSSRPGQRWTNVEYGDVPPDVPPPNSSADHRQRRLLWQVTRVGACSVP